MFAKIHTRFNNISLQNKLLLILLALLLLLSAAFVLGLNWIERIYRSQLSENVAAQLNYSGQEISDHLQAVESMSQMILSTPSVQEGLAAAKSSADPQRRAAVSEELRLLLEEYLDSFQSRHLNYINLYADSFAAGTALADANPVPAELHIAVRGLARKYEGKPVWLANYTSQYGLFLGRQILQNQDPALPPLGEIVINVDLEALIAQTAAQSSPEYDYAYFLLGKDAVVYRSPGFTYEQALYIQSNLQGSYKVLTLGGKKYFAVLHSLPDYGWDYVCLLAYGNVSNALLRAKLLLIILILTAGLIMFLSAFLVLHSVTRHFRLLADRMLAMGDDLAPPKPVYDYSRRSDEVGILHQQFDLMLERLRTQIQLNYINELAKKEAQIQVLENQINPHFLYNTLESVNWRAKAAGANDISEMVQALAAMLRVTLAKSNIQHTLGKELQLIRSYMLIQHYRFDDRLQYTIEAPADCADFPIPKLLIQPLVENAIHYGLEDSIDGCEIRISVQRQQHSIHIQVWNTGSAFEPQLLEKLHRQTVRPQGHGIALLNIEQRLGLAYGSAGTLRLYNREDWAIAEVILPWEGETPC